MKTIHHGYTKPFKVDDPVKVLSDWYDYYISTDNVSDIRPFMTRNIIPTGCCCIKDKETYKVKCRYYNDTHEIIRCELLGVDSKEYGELKCAVKVCNDPNISIIKPYMEIFE